MQTKNDWLIQSLLVYLILNEN